MKLAILISGSGTTMESIIKACKTGRLSNIKPVVVISSNPKAGGLEKAKKLSVETQVANPKEYKSRMQFGAAILDILKRYSPDIISLNGWLPLLPANFIRAFKDRIINQHPAPLDPEHKNGQHYDFGGKGMYGIVACAAIYFFRKLVIESKPYWFAKRNIPTEATVHIVTEKYDDGPVIQRTPMDIYDNDTPESIQKRLLPIEHETVIQTILDFTQNKVTVKVRPKPFVRLSEIKLLHKAKKKAIENYL